MTYERKIYLRETVDISSLNSPAHRAVSWRPVSRRPRGRTSKPSDSDRPSMNLPQGLRSASVESGDVRGARSPSMGAYSSVSALSNGSGLRHVPSIGESEPSSVTSSDEGRVITASVDILREGYLPGDSVPIRVTVRHTKPIKAMQGVIVTLYRRGRINPSAALNDGIDSGDKDDLFLRSRTGLGAIFTSNYFSHKFRYDLDQNIAPMIVNPNTMQGEVKTMVRIPEDVFPTITCVPHGLITFTYHVEVVMDLSGKLSAIDRLLPRFSMTRSTPNFELAGTQGFGSQQQAGTPHRIFDTMAIRRFDSVAHCTFDVIIGTKDTKRKGLKKEADPWVEAQRTFGFGLGGSSDEPSSFESYERSSSGIVAPLNHRHVGASQHSALVAQTSAETGYSGEKARVRAEDDVPLPTRPALERSASSSHSGGRWAQNIPPDIEHESAEPVSRDSRHSQATIRPPIPVIHDTPNEKERMRLHEESLMPSAPLLDDGPSDGPSFMSEDACSSGPSAPPATALGLEQAPDGSGIPTYSYAAASGASQSSDARLTSQAGSSQMAPSDDKQELERQRLLAQASQPESDDDEPVADGLAEASEAPFAPNAGPQDNTQLQLDSPTPDGRQGAWEGIDGVEHLPEYQR